VATFIAWVPLQLLQPLHGPDAISIDLAAFVPVGNLPMQAVGSLAHLQEPFGRALGQPRERGLRRREHRQRCRLHLGRRCAWELLRHGAPPSLCKSRFGGGAGQGIGSDTGLKAGCRPRLARDMSFFDRYGGRHMALWLFIGVVFGAMLLLALWRGRSRTTSTLDDQSPDPNEHRRAVDVLAATQRVLRTHE
jgi:hypothetical protein